VFFIVTFVIKILMKLRPREMKILSKMAQLWLVAKQISHTNGFFHLITLRQHYCRGLEIYRISWKIFEITWLFHISKLEAQLDGQKSSAQKQSVQSEDIETRGHAPLHSLPPHPGVLKKHTARLELQ
jgi:hypothetical protein